jgi:hypothetical protein
MVLLLLLSLVLVLLSGDGVPDAAGWLACAVHAASVAHVTHVPRVMRLRLFLLLVFVFVVDPDDCVVGDQGHVFARSAQGFLSRKGLLFVSTHRSYGDDATATIIVAK